MDSLHQRLLNVYDYLLDIGEVHSQTQFSERIGKTISQTNDAFKDRPKRCTLGLMKAIADAFPDILNREYLLTGEGQMEKKLILKVSSNMAKGYVDLLTRNFEHNNMFRPHVEAKAAAGFMAGVSEGEYGEDMRPVIPFFPNYDFTIEVQGKSMLPEYKEGDVLACRMAKDRLNPPIGKVCVIDAVDGAAVKEIADVTKSAIVCHSFNPDYKDYEVEFPNINQIAVVVGLVRGL